MILLVCGGRDFAESEAVERALDPIAGEIDIVIHGNAPGADTLVKNWCRDHGIHAADVRALWGFWGNAAGPRRNAAMLALRPDLLIAFPGGKGTENCVAQAERAGVPVKRVEARAEASRA